MDIKPANHQQPVSDDQELAKVLAGVEEKANKDSVGKKTNAAAATDSGLQFEESPAPAPATAPVDDATNASTNTPLPVPSVAPPSTSTSPELENIKKDALSELRPLVSKLNLPAEEKFDTLLLIIRSTDDQSLLSAAHDAAKSIADETRRATALLDIIKEVDFFSHKTAK